MFEKIGIYVHAFICHLFGFYLDIYFIIHGLCFDFFGDLNKESIQVRKKAKNIFFLWYGFGIYRELRNMGKLQQNMSKNRIIGKRTSSNIISRGG